VVDLGAGTGKLTRVLVPAFQRVVAVEPAEQMRRVLAQVCPNVDLLCGTGQDIPLGTASVDGVFAAQAFHMFDEETAVAEIARVLKRAGVLVLMWNLPAGSWEPSAEAAERVLRERGPAPSDVSYDPLDLGKVPRDTADESALAEPFFGSLQKTRLPNPHALDRDGLVAYYASMGWLADLPDEERLPLLDEVRSLLTAPEYCRLWDTHVHWARRR
jgi:SAM-dependent methyltransferase